MKAVVKESPGPGLALRQVPAPKPASARRLSFSARLIIRRRPGPRAHLGVRGDSEAKCGATCPTAACTTPPKRQKIGKRYSACNATRALSC